MNSILLDINGSFYKLRKVGENLEVNKKIIKMQLNRNKAEQKMFEDFCSEGYNDHYAGILTAIFYADYIEIGSSMIVGFIDHLVLYLFGYYREVPQLTNDIWIYIEDEEIWSSIFTKKLTKNCESVTKYQFDTYKSYNPTYDFGKLISNLIVN
jgi:hypothetical protein